MSRVVDVGPLHRVSGLLPVRIGVCCGASLVSQLVLDLQDLRDRVLLSLMCLVVVLLLNFLCISSFLGDLVQDADLLCLYLTLLRVFSDGCHCLGIML